jgi:hypothetical protein
LNTLDFWFLLSESRFYLGWSFALFQVGDRDFQYVVSPVKYASHIKVGNHLAVPAAKGWLHHMVVTKVDRRADGPVRVFVVHFWAETYKKADATIRRSVLMNSAELARAGLLLRMQYPHFISSSVPHR